MVNNEWKKTQLGVVMDFKNGLNTEKSNYGNGVKFVNVMDVFKNDILTEDKIIGRINLDPKKIEDNLLEYGDILFNRTSETYDEIAMSAVYLDNKPATFGGFVIRGRPIKETFDPNYSVYAFQSFDFRNQVIKLGQGAVRANIGQKDLAKVNFLIPPIEEQKKIAEILSTWDKVIETVEKLVANSQQQKKALMQHLLTGQKRLLDDNGGEFGDEWTNSSLSDLCKIKTGKKDVNEGNPNGLYPFFTCANLPTKSDSYSFDCEALLIAGNGILGKTHYYKGKFEAYQRTYVLTDFDKNINVPFLHQFILYFLTRAIEREKQHGAMPYIKLGLLQNFAVSTPSLKEQEKIAQVLTLADREIDLYLRQLDKLKLEKKALMQQLLTGQKRVKLAA